MKIKKSGKDMRKNVLLKIALSALLLFSSCGGKSGGEADPALVRNVTEYGAELNREFTLPKKALETGNVKILKADGTATALKPDINGKVIFNEIADYIVTYEGGKITVCVRDTEAPVFTKVTQRAYAVKDLPFDLSALAVAADNSGKVEYSYSVSFLSAENVEVTEENKFVPKKLGYYKAVITARDESGNSYSSSSKIEAVSVAKDEIAYFDNQVLPVSGTFGGTRYSKADEPKFGDSGYSLRLACNGTDNYASIAAGKDLSSVNEMYYYVYFDSSTMKGGEVDRLSEDAFPRPDGTNSTWDVSVCSDGETIAFDRWIRVKATLREGKTPLKDTLRLYAPNYRHSWYGDWNWEASKLSYAMYVDLVSVAPKHENNELAYFDGIDAAVRKDGPTVGLSETVRMGDYGRSAFLNVTNNDNYLIAEVSRDLSALSAVYYYVYIDSAFTKGEKPQNLSPDAIPRPDGAANAEVLAPLAYDTWLPVKVTFASGKLTGRKLQFYAPNYRHTWYGDWNWESSGLNYRVYVDNICCGFQSNDGEIFNVTPATRFGVSKSKNAAVELSQSYGYGEAYSLRVRAEAGGEGYISLTGLGISDFTRLKTLTFSVYNPNDFDIPLSAALHTAGAGVSGETVLKKHAFTKITIDREAFKAYLEQETLLSEDTSFRNVRELILRFSNTAQAWDGEARAYELHLSAFRAEMYEKSGDDEWSPWIKQ